MKKVLVLVVGLFLLGSATNAMAGTKWKMQVNTGGNVLASGFGSTDFGLGLGLGIGVAVNDTWSFWLNSNAYYDLQSTSITSLIFDEANLTAKCNFGSGGGVSPYFRAGLGTFYQVLTISYLGISVSGSTSNLMLQGGLGLEFPAGTGLSFFAEADSGIVLATGATGVTVPITAGLVFDL